MKTNPRRRPATQADVARAWDEGVLAGVTNACAIFLTVLVDKFDGGPYIPDVWREINKLSEEVGEGRVSVADLTSEQMRLRDCVSFASMRCVLREEYGIEV